MQGSPSEAHPTPTLSVLVVDDNAAAADSQATLVQLWGHAVQVAYDGPTAVQAFQAHSPDVVLLDLSLPGVDGYEVADQLRAISPGKRFALFALTGHGGEAERRRATNAGFDLYLVKPVDPTHLQDLLAALAQEKSRGQPPGVA